MSQKGRSALSQMTNLNWRSGSARSRSALTKYRRDLLYHGKYQSLPREMLNVGMALRLQRLLECMHTCSRLSRHLNHGLTMSSYTRGSSTSRAWRSLAVAVRALAWYNGDITAIPSLPARAKRR